MDPEVKGRTIIRPRLQVRCQCHGCGAVVLHELEQNENEDWFPPPWRWLSMTTDLDAFAWALVCSECAARVRNAVPELGLE